MKEHDIYKMIADYLRYQYPTVIYRFDLAADLKLTMGQASKHKRLQRYRGYPDLFIAAPVVSRERASNTDRFWCGLYLEIKKDGVRIFKQDGTLVSDEHIREQFDMLADLRQRGYAAEFAIGFEGAKKLIDDYMKGRYAHAD
jgi:hypothetical protein